MEEEPESEADLTISEEESCDSEIINDNNINFSFLLQLLMDHAAELLASGVSYEEVERFCCDPKSLENFFEARGLYIRPPQIDKDIEHTGQGSGGDEGRARSKLSKLFRSAIYVLIFVVVCVIGHVSICYVLDINPLKYFPSLQEKRCLLPAHPILMEMTRPVADCDFCRDNDVVIEMAKSPSKGDFSKLAYLSKPVIIRGGGRNGGMPEGFNFEKLKHIFQSEPGGVDAVSEECQFLPFRSPFQSLREAFDKIAENSSYDEPWYIGWSNCHPGVAAKLRELFPRPDFLPEDSSSSAIDWIFIGSPGLGASMHIDYVKRPSWQAQLSGIKRWILHPPPECESVCPDSVTFDINPGDLLFLETNCWYHQTHIMEEGGLSISIGSEYD